MVGDEEMRPQSAASNQQYQPSVSVTRERGFPHRPGCDPKWCPWNPPPCRFLLRTDLDADQMRIAAHCSKDGPQSRRVLAIASHDAEVSVK